jgi:hypothetical protein
LEDAVSILDAMIGEQPPDRTVPLIALALAAPLCAIEPGKGSLVVHAVTMEEVVRKGLSDEPALDDALGCLTAPCGATGLLVIGEHLGQEVPLPWPPRVKGLAPGVRCRECWVATGRKKPRCGVPT